MIAGIKYDGDKLMYNLVPMQAQEEVVKVLTHGAKKYAPDNWKQVPDLQDRYYSAALRHLEAHRAGERYDIDSGLPHLAHVACCMLFKLQDDIDGQNEKVRNGGQSSIQSAAKAAIGEFSDSLHEGGAEVRGEQLDERNFRRLSEGEGQLIEALLSASFGRD